MSNLRNRFGVLLLAAPIALVALSPALAASSGGTRKDAWVSGLGTDASGCGPLATPCRSFQYAHDSVVTPGGTIYVKDPANYVTSPPFVISHAISIINDGAGPATIAAPSTDAIDIQAASTDKILIKGLVLDGLSGGLNGINLMSAGIVIVDDCTAKGFGGTYPNGNGILVQPKTGTLIVAVSDSILSNNLYSGIQIEPGALGNSAGAANVTASLTRVAAIGDGQGFILANDWGSGIVQVVADGITSNGNTSDGIFVRKANVYLARSTASGNARYGIWNNSNSVYSGGDNAIYGDGSAAVAGSPVILAPLQ